MADSYESAKAKRNDRAKAMCFASGGPIHVKPHSRVPHKAGGGMIMSPDMPVMGGAAKPKLNGKSKVKSSGKKGTTVNILVGHPPGAPGPGLAAPPMPMPHPMPPGPPMAGAAPVMPPRPMAPPMPGMKKGGRVKKKADGGTISSIVAPKEESGWDYGAQSGPRDPHYGESDKQSIKKPDPPSSAPFGDEKKTPPKKAHGGKVKKRADGGSTGWQDFKDDWDKGMMQANAQHILENQDEATKNEDVANRLDGAGLVANRNYHDVAKGFSQEAQRRMDNDKRQSDENISKNRTAMRKKAASGMKAGGKVKHKDDGGPIIGDSTLKKPDKPPLKVATGLTPPAASGPPLSLTGSGKKPMGMAMDSDNDATMPNKQKNGGKVTCKASGGSVKEITGAGGGLARLEKAKEAKRLPHKAGGGAVSHMAGGGSADGKMGYADAVGSGLMDDAYGVGRLAAKGVGYIPHGNQVLTAMSQYLRDQGMDSPDWGNPQAVQAHLDARDKDIEGHLPEESVLGHRIPTGQIARFAGAMAPAVATLPFGGAEAESLAIAQRGAAAEKAAYEAATAGRSGITEFAKGMSGKPGMLSDIRAAVGHALPKGMGISAADQDYGKGDDMKSALGTGLATEFGAKGLGSLATKGSAVASSLGKVRGAQNIVRSKASALKGAVGDIGKQVSDVGRKVNDVGRKVEP